jgi:hypothetical protein
MMMLCGEIRSPGARVNVQELAVTVAPFEGSQAMPVKKYVPVVSVEIVTVLP